MSHVYDSCISFESELKKYPGKPLNLVLSLEFYETSSFDKNVS